MKNTHRLFLALELNDASKHHISQIISTLQKKQSDPSIRWTPNDNLHVTIKFIGETHPDVLAVYLKHIPDSLSGIHPFSIKIHRFLSLPPHTPHLIALGVERSFALQNLFIAIENFFSGLDLPNDKHAFIPHITLARTKHHPEIITQLLKQPQKKAFEQAINHLTLFRTDPSQTDIGSVYVPIKRFSLGSTDTFS